MLLSQRSASPSKATRTLRDPAPMGKMGEHEAEHEEEGASICRVPDISIEACGDELVHGVHSEVGGEELTEGFGAIEADVGA